MPYQRYRQDLQRDDFTHDPAQEQAILKLQRVYDDLINHKPAQTSGRGLLNRLFGRQPTTAKIPVRGLYLWGGVGRGKTYLVDAFFDALPFEDKKRLHFHRFMYKVHGELKTLQGQQDPLKIVADRFAAQARILCLDEFIVTDITDAMLLSGLLDALFERGVTLVTTSNIEPDDLYRDGLQRARFLPAIELIKTHLEVFHLDEGTDYRLRYLERAEIYHTPLDAAAETVLNDSFEHIAPEPGQHRVTLEVEGREIIARRRADGVAWFEFDELCDGPRSQADYIELARCFHTVLLSNVPVMDVTMENQARRFLNLIDEFYDRNVNLIISAAAPPESIYQGQRLVFEYRRTVSRLQEMQSHEYLARRHLP